MKRNRLQRFHVHRRASDQEDGFLKAGQLYALATSNGPLAGRTYEIIRVVKLVRVAASSKATDLHDGAEIGDANVQISVMQLHLSEGKYVGSDDQTKQMPLASMAPRFLEKVSLGDAGSLSLDSLQLLSARGVVAAESATEPIELQISVPARRSRTGKPSLELDSKLVITNYEGSTSVTGVGKVLLGVSSCAVSDVRTAREKVAAAIKAGGTFSLTVWEPPAGWADAAAAPSSSSTAAASSAGSTEMLPSWEESDMHNFIRVCKRLFNGSMLANVKNMASALGLCGDGEGHTLKIRIELKLRELGFERNTEFTPTAEDLQLCDADFDEKFDEQRPHSISAVVRMLTSLGAAAPPVEAPSGSPAS